MYELYRETFFEYISGGNIITESSDTSRRLNEEYKKCIVAVKKFKKSVNKLDSINKKLKRKIDSGTDTNEMHRHMYTANQTCVNNTNEQYRTTVKQIKEMKKTMNIEGLVTTKHVLQVATKTVEKQTEKTQTMI